MTATPEIDAARAALTTAEAEVSRLQARLRAELADQDARGVSAEAQPRRHGWTEGKAEAQRRYPKGEGASVAPFVDEAARVPAASGAAAGVAEARRRSASV